MGLHSPIVAAWRWIERYADHEDPLARASNWIALVVASNQPFYPLYLYAVVGDRFIPSLLTFFSTPFFAAVPAVSRRHPFAGRVMLPLVGIGNGIVAAKALGPASGVELFLIPCALIAAALFRPSERLVGFVLIGTAFLSYFLLHGRYGAPLSSYTDAEYATLFSINVLSAAGLTVFIGLLLRGIIHDTLASPR
ncbi:MAG: hypothetical protein JNK47_13535 [Mesorhizobium sp.]|nr:hypothetical protein [Mesorhizobium sp.]MBL8578244.1 hypothetical protein [Mesorhizobium sp.]